MQSMPSDVLCVNGIFVRFIQYLQFGVIMLVGIAYAPQLSAADTIKQYVQLPNSRSHGLLHIGHSTGYGSI
jgi:hypothetical protein